MSDSDSGNARAGDDDQFAARLQAEVVAAAERRRREDVNVARVEREIERVWAHVAPPGAVGPTQELLLDRVDRLSLIDVDAPIGDKPGVRQVKGAIRKGTYWYLRYMSDQLNALHNVHARLLRRMDERLDQVEAALGIDARVDALASPAPVPDAALGALIAESLADVERPVMVAACGAGASVLAMQTAGVVAFGLDPDPVSVLAGIDAGADLRVGDGGHDLEALEAGSLGAVVIAGALQRQPVSALLALIDLARAAVGSGGVLVVVPEDLAARAQVDVELLAGRGLSAESWQHVLDRQGMTTERRDHGGVGLDAVVIARCP